MGKQQPKTQNKSGNRFKKEYNNYNPYNKLELNKFHQIQDQKQTVGLGHQLHKKKRDLERILEYRKRKGLQIEPEKLNELEKIQQQLQNRKGNFQKEKRKEFFLQSKYKQIMNIEKRKIAKKLRQIKEKSPVNQEELIEWIKKLNYVKHFPKNLKYISLFPNSPMNEKALEFQQKIINDIETDLSKKKQKLNSFETQYKVVKKSKPSKRDDFFLQEEQAVEQNEQNEDQNQNDNQNDDQQNEEQVESQQKVQSSQE